MNIFNRLALPVITATLSMIAVSNAYAAQPLELAISTPLPAVTGGDFDHFAVDLAKNRLWVPSEKYESIEVFNLKSGAHLKSGTGLVKSPHMMKFIKDTNELFVADAKNGYCEVLDADDLHLIKRIVLKPGADFGVYDPKTRLIYLGNGGKAVKSPFSTVSVISVDKKEVVGEIQLEAGTLKGMKINKKTNRLYVNMRDKNQIAVIDLKTRALVDLWTAPGLKSNAAIALDEKNDRLFIGSRHPGVMFVFDSNNGKLITTFNTVDVSDDMTFDGKNHRLMVSGADGVDVFAQDNPDTYRPVQHVDTLGGKTSVYVRALDQFYVVHTKSDKVPEAGLQVFKVNY